MKKYLIAVSVAVLMLSAAPTAQANGGLSCKLTDVQMWEAPDLDGIEIMLGLRLKCTARGGSVRILSRDVTVIPDLDPEYQLSPDRDKETFYTIFDVEPYPRYVGKFLDVPAGATVDIGYTFTGGADLTSLEGTLDLNGYRVRYKRKPTPTYFDVVSDEEKAALDKHHAIWDYK